MRPDCDIPNTLNGLVKDIAEKTGLSKDDIFTEAISRRSLDLISEMKQKGEADVDDLADHLERFKNGL